MKYLTLLFVLILTGCVASPVNFENKEAENVAPTKFKRPFPKPETGQPIVVAVYAFTDKTGQRKDSATIAKFSTAVTQGGESLLLRPWLM